MQNDNVHTLQQPIHKSSLAGNGITTTITLLPHRMQDSQPNYTKETWTPQIEISDVRTVSEIFLNFKKFRCRSCEFTCEKEEVMQSHQIQNHKSQESRMNMLTEIIDLL